MPFTSLVLCNDAEALAALAAAMDVAQIKRELCSGSAHAKKLLTNRKFDAVFFDCDAVEGLDETLFIGEEVYFSLALKKLGRFKILSEPVVTSGRKLRMYSAGQILARSFSIILRGRRGASSRAGLDLWYDGKRETSPVAATGTRAARST